MIDVHVALVAAERGHAVLTFDDADIAQAFPRARLTELPAVRRVVRPAIHPSARAISSL